MGDKKAQSREKREEKIQGNTSIEFISRKGSFQDQDRSRQAFYCPSLREHSNDVTLYNTSLIIITFFILHLSMQSYKFTKQIKHLKIK